MEKMTVKVVDGDNQKTFQEKEKELLEKAENEKKQTDNENSENELQEKEVETYTPKSEDVLLFLKKEGIEVSSLDDLKKPKENNDVPDDIKGYLEYHKNTGRGMEDYLALQRDVSKIPADQLLFDFYKANNEGLDDDDINYLIDSELGYDEDEDEEGDIKRKKIIKKKKIAEAKEYFEKLKEQYKAPIVSKEKSVPGKSDEAEAQSNDEPEVNEAYLRFKENTNKLFSNNFEGFEFDITDDKKEVFKPKMEALKIAEFQSDLNNFVMKFMDKETMEIKDVKAYHKALFTAANADSIASYFYEKGKADAIKSETSKFKNPSSEVAKVAAKGVIPKGEMKVKAVSTSSTGLKMK